MERYVRGEETWTDNIEKHKDNGKGHLFCRPYQSAAAINTFDPENPYIKPLRDNALESVKKAFVNDFLMKKFGNRMFVSTKYHLLLEQECTA
jgi:hypothetical protein